MCSSMAKSKSAFKIGKGKLVNQTSITESDFEYLLPSIFGRILFE